MREAIRGRLNENILRVRNLVSIYETHLAGTGRGRRGAAKTDVLRASTVLLHASLEDCLRSLAYWRLPLSTKDVLDGIPLKSAAPATKFSLGALTNYRGKTINDVIKESVDHYLDRSNFNNLDEISSFLRSIAIEPTRVNATYPVLDELMKRRHQIVHRADRDETGGRGNHTVRSIGRTKVNAWIDAVDAFCNAVLNQTPA